MKEIHLDRPLAVFDIEATGTNPRLDRIVEITVTKLDPTGTRETHTFRVHPECPIPAAVIAIHGITDADVADCPPFRKIAATVHDLLQGCDLAGFNVLRYDIPMLVEEFLRADITFVLEGRRVYDAQRVYHQREPRDLTAALAFYCGKEHTNAHGAEADVEATIQVMEGQLQMYSDLPRDMDALDEYCRIRKPDWADRNGRLKWNGTEVVLNFGKKQGTPIREMATHDRRYLNWILKSDFPSDTKHIVQQALDHDTYPEPPKP